MQMIERIKSITERIAQEFSLDSQQQNLLERSLIRWFATEQETQPLPLQVDELASRLKQMAYIFDLAEKRSAAAHQQDMFHSEWKELERLMLQCSSLLDKKP